MALFKILKGNEANLPADKHEGWAYVTEKGNMYVDLSNDKRVKIGNRADTAEFADKATGDEKSIQETYVASVVAQSDNKTVRVTKGDGTYNDVKLYFAGSSSFGGAANSANILNGHSEKLVTGRGGDGKLRYTYNVSNGTAGLFDVNNNANAIITLSKHAGNYDSQLGFSSNGKIYYRSFNGGALDTTTKWKQIAFTDTVVDKATQAEKDWVGQVIDETYMKYPLTISGETITMTRGDGETGTITVPDKKVTQSNTNAANYRPVILGATHTATIADLNQTVRDQVYVSTKFYASPSQGIFVAPTFKGDLDGNAKTATNATYSEKDKEGNIIADTYIATLKQDTSNGTTFSFKGVSAGGDNRPDVISVPAATATVAGLVTNAAQTFAGVKTFKNNIDVKGKVIIDLNGNKVEIGSDNKSYFHFLVRSQATTPLTFWFGGPIQTAGGITPYGHNTYDLGSSGSRWKTGYFGSGGINVSGTITDKDANELRAKLFVSTLYANTSTGSSFIIGGKNTVGDEITSLTIPNASTTSVGLITNAAQTLAGNKTFTGDIYISHATTADMAYNTTNPKLVFSESGSQPVGIVYTDYDSYRSPAGLKIMSTVSNNGAAWLEVEGDLFVKGHIYDKNGDILLADRYVSTLYTHTSNASTFKLGGKNYDGDVITNHQIPNASTTVAGLITAETQDLKGNKTLDGTFYGKADFHRFTAGQAVYRTYMPSGNNKSVGWYRIAKVGGLEGYANFVLHITGGWNTGAPATAQLHIQIRHTTVRIRQISGIAGLISKVRIVGDTTNGYYLEVYQNQTYSSTTGMAQQTFFLIGDVNATTYKPTTNDGSGTAVAECPIRTYDNTYVNSGTANRMAYYSAAGDISSTGHYTSTSQVGINTTNTTHIGDYSLYVEDSGKGTARFSIGDNDLVADKKVVIGSPGNRYLSFGGSGVQAYDASNKASVFYINYNGGNFQVGSSASLYSLFTLFGGLTIKGTTSTMGSVGFNYEGIGTAADDAHRVIWFAYNGRNGTPVYDTDFVYNPHKDKKELKVKRILISDTTSGNYLKFARNSYGYILGGGNDATISINPSGTAGSAYSVLTIGQKSVFPDMGDITVDLGRSDKYWKTFYTNNIYLKGTTKWRVMWVDGDGLVNSSYHFANSSKIGVNYTSEPSYNFYVNGTTYLSGNLTYAPATANMMLWVDGSKIVKGSNHYVTTDRIAINSTSKPSYNLYVNGSFYLSGNMTLNAQGANRLVWTDDKKIINASGHYASSTQIGIGTTNTTNIGSYILYVEGASKINGNLTVNGLIYGSLSNNKIDITVNGDANTYYPVVINSNPTAHHAGTILSITRGYSETAPSSWHTSTHKGGLTLTILWNGSRYWDGNGAGSFDVHTTNILQLKETYTTMVAGLDSSNTGLVVWLRGGGAVYHIYSQRGTLLGATVYTSTYTDSVPRSFAPKTAVDTDNLNKKRHWVVRGGDTMLGTLTTRDLIPSSNNAYTVGNSTTKYLSSHVYTSYAYSRFTTVNTDGAVNFYAVNDGKVYALNVGLNVDPDKNYRLKITGNTFLNGVAYFANGTTYYINNSGTANLNAIYAQDFMSDNVRIVDNWIGWYATARNSGTTRYGYIQNDLSSGGVMRFVREQSGYFTFNSYVAPSSQRGTNLGSSSLQWNNIYTRAIAIRHIDASATDSDKELYIGYGSIQNTLKTRFYYSSSTSARTQFAEINSNGLYALTRFGVNGQNTSYNFYVNGSSYFNGNTTHNGIDYFANGTTYYINNSAHANLRAVGSSDSTFIAYPQGGGFRTATSAYTGYLKITLPQSWTNTMMSFKIQIYEYQTGYSCEYVVGGYNYTGATWANRYFAYSTGKNDQLTHSNLTVRLGHDGTKCAIYIGESNTSWSYPQIQVHSIVVGYSNYEYSKWSSGWSVGFTTTLGTITATVTNPNSSFLSTGTTYVKDRTNGTATYLNYGAAGITAPSWFAAWNGYELRAISPTETRKGINAMAAIYANSFYGMGQPDGDTSNWIRTTANGLIPYQSGSRGSGHCGIGTSSWYFSSAYIDTVNSNTTYAYNWFRSYNASGWYNETYQGGIYMADSTFVRVYNAKRFLVDNTVHIYPREGNYSEGLRIYQYGSWSDILLGGNDLTATTGTSANSWFIGNNNGTFNITRNGSSTGTAYLRCVSNKWYMNTTTGSEQLNVGGWIGTVGATGWYNITYGGGWFMQDSTWMRSYASKSLYMGTGIIRTDLVAGGTWIAGTHDGAIQVRAATTAAAGYFFQSWFSGKTPSGAWGIGPLAGSNDLYFSFGTDANYNAGTNTTSNIRFGSNGTVWGAVWNDYAEFRKSESLDPGRVVIEDESGEMKLATERLQPGANIISDTYGFTIGETKENKTPIAVAGRVLAYTFEDRYSYPLGSAVCSGPNGTVSLMTREEIREYPERIIGTVSEIPEYETWGTDDIKVNGRIWIKVK